MLHRAILYKSGETESTWDCECSGIVHVVDEVGLEVRDETTSSVLSELRFDRFAFRQSLEKTVTCLAKNSAADAGERVLSFETRESCDFIWDRISRLTGEWTSRASSASSSLVEMEDERRKELTTTGGWEGSQSADGGSSQVTEERAAVVDEAGGDDGSTATAGLQMSDRPPPSSSAHDFGSPFYYQPSFQNQQESLILGGGMGGSYEEDLEADLESLGAADPALPSSSSFSPASFPSASANQSSATSATAVSGQKNLGSLSNTLRAIVASCPGSGREVDIASELYLWLQEEALSPSRSTPKRDFGRAATRLGGFAMAVAATTDDGDALPIPRTVLWQLRDDKPLFLEFLCTASACLNAFGGVAIESSSTTPSSSNRSSSSNSSSSSSFSLSSASAAASSSAAPSTAAIHAPTAGRNDAVTHAISWFWDAFLRESREAVSIYFLDRNTLALALPIFSAIFGRPVAPILAAPSISDVMPPLQSLTGGGPPFASQDAVVQDTASRIDSLMFLRDVVLPSDYHENVLTLITSQLHSLSLDYLVALTDARCTVLNTSISTLKSLEACKSPPEAPPSEDIFYTGAALPLRTRLIRFVWGVLSLARGVQHQCKLTLYAKITNLPIVAALSKVLGDRNAPKAEVLLSIEILLNLASFNGFAALGAIREICSAQCKDSAPPIFLDAELTPTPPPTAASVVDDGLSIRLAEKLQSLGQPATARTFNIEGRKRGEHGLFIKAEIESPLLVSLIWRVVDDPDASIQSAASDMIRTIIDYESHESTEKEAILSAWYDHLISLLLSPFSHPVISVPDCTHGPSKAASMAFRDTCIAFDLRPSQAGTRLDVSLGQDHKFRREITRTVIPLLGNGFVGTPLFSDSSISRTSKGIITDLLVFCMTSKQHSKYKLTYVTLRTKLITKMVKLLRYSDGFLVHAALRFLKACVNLPETFYHRELIKNDLLCAVFAVLLGSVHKWNAITSTTIELIVSIADSKSTPLIDYAVHSFRPILQMLLAVPNIDLLLKIASPVPSDMIISWPEKNLQDDGSGSKVEEEEAPVVSSDAGKKRKRSASEDDASFFSSSSDNSTASPPTSSHELPVSSSNSAASEFDFPDSLSTVSASKADDTTSSFTATKRNKLSVLRFRLG